MVKQSRTRQCRNKRIPDGLTEAFQEKLLSLRASVKTDYLKEQVFSKFVSADTAPAEVRRTRAINKWLATERDNEATNVRLLLTPAEYNILPRVSYGRFVAFCRDLIAEIIGETAPVDALIGAFSGGASTSRKRTESHPAQKYLGKAHVTQRCLELFFDTCIDEMPGWLWDCTDLEFETVPGNVLFTVPKNTDIDRCACKEPDVNMFVQKGIGNHFRESLRRIGINLNDQSINRSLARVGSIDGSLATLDLSSASDSVTSGLVAEMLPESWYTLLDSVRSPVTIIDGEEHRNEMFSSMGNGFTFELQSILYYAFARAVCFFTGTPGKVSVYGDDIICPSEAAPQLIDVLYYLGFSTNIEKTHFTGAFRESCGGHYSNGYDITPFYVKAPFRTLVDLIHVANQLREWGSIPELGIIDPEVEDIWLWLKGYIPSYLWGGVDTSYKFQLVSNDLPSKRLQLETNRRRTGTGGYIHWLNTTWDREPSRKPIIDWTARRFGNKYKLPLVDSFQEVSTSQRSTDIGTYVLKPSRHTVPRLTALFLHEIR
jgi:hypothetical protein